MAYAKEHLLCDNKFIHPLFAAEARNFCLIKVPQKSRTRKTPPDFGQASSRKAKLRRAWAHSLEGFILGTKELTIKIHHLFRNKHEALEDLALRKFCLALKQKQSKSTSLSFPASVAEKSIKYYHSYGSGMRPVVNRTFS